MLKCYTPNGHEFAVRADGHTALSARDFLKEVKYKSAAEVLGVPIHNDEVIEIDDGLRPHFFHVEDGEVKVLSRFQCDRARENQYMERTTPQEDLGVGEYIRLSLEDDDIVCGKLESESITN